MLRHHHHLLILFLLILTVTTTAVTPDAAALLTLKSTLDPTNSLHYTLTEPLDYCHWQGVKCQGGQVVRLSLPSNSLSGVLPSPFPSLPHLRVLVLRNNSISGHLPHLSDSLPLLRSLLLSHNNFSGDLSLSDLTHLSDLRVLDLSFNRFSGHLPHRLSDLHFLTSLLLQFNSFDGELPSLNQSTLIVFNIAGNNFSGDVPAVFRRFPPSCFAFNPNLCGELVNKTCFSPSSPFFNSSAAAANSTPSSAILSPPSNNNHRMKKKNTVLILVFSFAGVILFTSFVCLFLTTRARMKSAAAADTNTTNSGDSTSSPDAIEKTYFSATTPSREVIRVTLDAQTNEFREKNAGKNGEKKSGKLVFCEAAEGGMYTIEQLMRASAEMLGRGTMGTTYKAKLDNQLIVTVKRLDAVKMSGVDGEVFERHMEVVGRLRHPNLVVVRAYFQAQDERLIIFDYQPNGSVFSLIHGSRSTRAKPLHWTSCLKIAEDVAQALAYIHQGSKLIHGNLKASNVLLGADFEACLTDYCLATLAESSQAQDSDPDSARYKGPEARQSGRRATHKSDVYAFGVLLLELVSGKRPSQHPFLAPPDMTDWVKAVRGVDDGCEETQLGMLVDVATLCSSTSPEQRPTMWQVLRMIQRIKASVGPDDGVDTSVAY